MRVLGRGKMEMCCALRSISDSYKDSSLRSIVIPIPVIIVGQLLLASLIHQLFPHPPKEDLSLVGI